MKKIIYIDDEADSEKMESKFEIMRDEGLDVIPVSLVGEVMDTLKRYSSSMGLIVLDVIMPPEDVYSLAETNGGTTTGFRVLEDIRSIYKDVPIIIVSIKRSSLAGDLLKKYSVTMYLEKPISAERLVEAIKSTLLG